MFQRSKLLHSKITQFSNKIACTILKDRMKFGLIVITLKLRDLPWKKLSFSPKEKKPNKWNFLEECCETHATLYEFVMKGMTGFITEGPSARIIHASLKNNCSNYSHKQENYTQHKEVDTTLWAIIETFT